VSSKRIRCSVTVYIVYRVMKAQILWRHSEIRLERVRNESCIKLWAFLKG